MNKEELFNQFQKILLSTNGGNDDYVVAICQISNLIKEFVETNDQQLAELKTKNEELQADLDRFKGTKLGDFAEEIRELKEDLKAKDLLVDCYMSIVGTLDNAKNLQQQLKGKEQEIEKWKQKWAEGEQRCVNLYSNNRANTKQVCDKIIERYNLENKPITDAFGDTQYGYVMISAKDLKQFLDQIEKGEDNG